MTLPVAAEAVRRSSSSPSCGDRKVFTEKMGRLPSPLRLGLRDPLPEKA